MLIYAKAFLTFQILLIDYVSRKLLADSLVENDIRTSGNNFSLNRISKINLEGL